MANRTRSKKRSKSKKMYRQRGGVFTQQQIQSFNEIPEAAINAWSNSNIDYNFFPQAIQQFNDAIQQSTQAIETFRANYIQNIIDIADKIRQDTPMDLNELMIQIVSPPGSPVSVASSRMNEGGRRRKTRQTKKSRKTRKQRGGANFSEAQRQELLDQGFTEDNIETLIQEFPNTDAGDVMDSIQQLLSQNNTPQEIIDNLNNDNENNLSGIASSANGSVNNVSVGSLALGDENENDVSGIDDDNVSQHNISVDSFEDEDEDNNLNNNIDDISEDSIISNKGDTTREEDSSYMDDIGELDFGGRRRKTRKGKNGKKTRKQRGGTEFSEEQLTELGRLGFNDQQKKILARGFSITPPNMAMESIRQALQHNYITGQPDTVESIMRMFPAPVNVEGGKRRKSRKSRKMRGHKQRGGMRYGTGVGANCFDPNYSIYNTPALSLFPYKPN
jgi:hypothetical protein